MEIYEKQIILPVFITQSMMGTVGQTSEQLKTKKKGRKSGSSQLFSAKDNLANRCMFIKVYLLVISLFTCVFFSCSVLISLSHVQFCRQLRLMCTGHHRSVLGWSYFIMTSCDCFCCTFVHLRVIMKWGEGLSWELGQNLTRQNPAPYFNPSASHTHKTMEAEFVFLCLCCVNVCVQPSSALTPGARDG